MSVANQNLSRMEIQREAKEILLVNSVRKEGVIIFPVGFAIALYYFDDHDAGYKIVVADHLDSCHYQYLQSHHHQNKWGLDQYMNVLFRLLYVVIVV